MGKNQTSESTLKGDDTFIYSLVDLNVIKSPDLKSCFVRITMRSCLVDLCKQPPVCMQHTAVSGSKII